MLTAFQHIHPPSDRPQPPTTPQATANFQPDGGGPEDHFQVDLADLGQVEAAVARMKARLEREGGRLDALVNNAAVSPKRPDGSRLNSIETTSDDWQRVFKVNFYAPIMLARGLVDELARARGCVVNVTSNMVEGYYVRLL